MGVTKSSRVELDVGTIDESPQLVPPERRHSRARGGAGTRRRRGRGRASAGVRFLTGILLVAGLTGAAIGVDGFIQASNARSRAASLQAQLNSLQQRVSADERGAATERAEVGKVAGRTSGVQRSVSRSLARLNWSLQSVPSQGELARLRAALVDYGACVGQLQGELDGLGINWRIDPTRPSTDYFRLFTATPGSAACSGVR